MDKINALYESMGISPAVYQYGEAAIARLRERFDAIDQVAEYNHEAGKVFAKCLEHAGVYKRDEKGIAAFEKFISTLA